ncbi:MAG: RNA methyltransferase [Deltaproteobacteria bacterium]|nr:RNA methyltransferase [Deltaproteobacteria bacterium]
MSRPLTVALLHHPVLDRGSEVITTAVTNLDVHDIARSAHTFGAAGFAVVHPVAAQRELVRRIRDHWVEGSGGRRIPDRRPAMQGLSILPALDDALAQAGAGAELWVTSAAAGGSLPVAEARDRLRAEGAPVVLVFGTGWGLAPEVLARAAERLEPIRSPRADGYNHLSVRAAAAIYLDRLLGV